MLSKKARVPKIRAVHRAGGNTLNLYNIGFGEAQFHGSEVVGMDDLELRQSRRLCLKIAGPGTPTRSFSLGLCLLEDPCWRP
eukprot:4395423-Pyramimonas_sp.AAC.1